MNKLILLIVPLLLSSCVASKKYKSLQSEVEEMKTSLQQCKGKLVDCEQQRLDVIMDNKNQLSTLDSDIKSKAAKITDLESQLDYLKKSQNSLLDRLSDLSVVSKEGATNIRKSLEALDEKDKYIKNLTGSMQRKDSMNLALVLNLKRSLSGENSEDVNIEVKKGVVYISLSDNMLFKTGSAVINDKANQVLAKIAKVLNDHADLEVLVEGHTDNVPISTDCVSDNWDLSTKRANAVVRMLAKKFNVNPSRMTAGGRSEFDPKADNATNEGRKINRRTEIIILPKLDQFFQLMETKK